MAVLDNLEAALTLAAMFMAMMMVMLEVGETPCGETDEYQQDRNKSRESCRTQTIHYNHGTHTTIETSVKSS